MFSDITKVVVPTKEKNKDDKPKFALVGYKIGLIGGGYAFFCKRTNTISITSEPTLKYYRSGSVVTNSVGIPEKNKPSKIKGVPVEKLHKYYGQKFVESIIKVVSEL